MLTFADQPSQFAVMQVGRTETAVSHVLAICVAVIVLPGAW